MRDRGSDAAEARAAAKLPEGFSASSSATFGTGPDESEDYKNVISSSDWLHEPSIDLHDMWIPRANAAPPAVSVGDSRE